MSWQTLSDGSLRSGCGRFDLLKGYAGGWVLVDGETGRVRRFVEVGEAMRVAEQSKGGEV